MKGHILILFCFGFLQISHQWSGHVCSYKSIRYRARTICTQYFIWCLTHATVYDPYYVSAQKCCAGWTHSGDNNCNKPTCNPACQNGGTCTSPNRCTCRPGNTGRTCSGVGCSNNKPCFPGDCPTINNQLKCKCASGYLGPTCLKLSADLDPEMTENKVRFGFKKRGPSTDKETYWRIEYANAERTEVVIWTSLTQYNRYNVTTLARFKGQDLPLTPDYINEAKIGLVSAVLRVVHTKKAGTDDITYYDNSTCPGPTKSQPGKTVQCSFSEDNYPRSFENGDTLNFTFQVESGGFRQLKDVSTGQNAGTQYFIGNSARSSVVFRFDDVKPNYTLYEDAFRVFPEFSKAGISMNWTGWYDIFSGMWRYTWEVFHLEVDGNGDLTEKDILNPIVHKGVNHTDNITFPSPYVPDKPGMYSFILEAVDKANNSIRMRRLALFDNVSSVTTDPKYDISVTSSSDDVGHYWMTNVSDSLFISWDNHFLNKDHEDGRYLSRVLEFSMKIIDDPPVFKSVSITNDDHEGMRTTKAVPNLRGIVSFEIAMAINKEGHVTKTKPKGSEMLLGLNTSFTCSDCNIGGESLTPDSTMSVWIKARDSVDNVMEEVVYITVDTSDPNFQLLKFHDNKLSDTPFSSVLELVMLDEESGISHVEIQLRVLGDDQTLSNLTLPVNSIDSVACTDTIADCYCPKALGECYKRTYNLPISNCIFILTNDSTQAQGMEMKVGVVNRAGLVSSKLHEINNIYDLNGTRAYFGPMDVTVKRVEETTARVTWHNPPGCFPRTLIRIRYVSDTGNAKEVTVFKDAEQFDLIDLDPGRSYEVTIVTEYGSTTSEAQRVTFETAKAGIAIATIAAIVIGVLLVIAIIVGVYLWRTGRAQSVIRRGQTIYRERISRHFTNVPGRNNAHAFANSAYGQGFDEDIYGYGSMEFLDGNRWYIPKENLTLLDVLSTGRFARIYRAEHINGKNTAEVVAKVLKDPPNESNKLLMMAKINFALHDVGEHHNVLHLIGGVTNNEELGPVMVMEYCELGQLDKWLTAHRESIDEDILEKIQTFALGIARGMAFLVTKKIAHRKLAARNCLLNSHHEVKIYGFGPSQDESSDNDASKADRIPIKWTAPECLHSLKDANEQSDMWSYGVTLWELFTCGLAPYSGVRSKDLPARLRNGLRLEKPEYAEDLHFNIMQDSWNIDANSRPKFADVVAKLEASFGIKPTNDEDPYYYAR